MCENHGRPVPDLLSLPSEIIAGPLAKAIRFYWPLSHTCRRLHSILLPRLLRSIAVWHEDGGDEAVFRKRMDQFRSAFMSKPELLKQVRSFTIEQTFDFDIYAGTEDIALTLASIAKTVRISFWHEGSKGTANFLRLLFALPQNPCLETVELEWCGQNTVYLDAALIALGSGLSRMPNLRQFSLFIPHASGSIPHSAWDGLWEGLLSTAGTLQVFEYVCTLRDMSPVEYGIAQSGLADVVRESRYLDRFRWQGGFYTGLPTTGVVKSVITALIQNDYAQLRRLAVENVCFSMEESTLLAQAFAYSRSLHCLEYFALRSCTVELTVDDARLFAFAISHSRTLRVLELYFVDSYPGTLLHELGNAFSENGVLEVLAINATFVHHEDLEGIAHVVCTSPSVHTLVIAQADDETIKTFLQILMAKVMDETSRTDLKTRLRKLVLEQTSFCSTGLSTLGQIVLKLDALETLGMVENTYQVVEQSPGVTPPVDMTQFFEQLITEKRASMGRFRISYDAPDRFSMRE
ncbi:hypothetical protein BJ742DRAFT_805072 [Cladochytrium replicatum]|nr:hypothetical protein BJ742DRAFT_805072 [Cladochytrium replicatum]